MVIDSIPIQCGWRQRGGQAVVGSARVPRHGRPSAPAVLLLFIVMRCGPLAVVDARACHVSADAVLFFFFVFFFFFFGSAGDAGSDVVACASFRLADVGAAAPSCVGASVVGSRHCWRG